MNEKEFIRSAMEKPKEMRKCVKNLAVRVQTSPR